MLFDKMERKGRQDVQKESRKRVPRLARHL